MSALPDGYPDVLGGDLAVVRAGADGVLTSDQVRDAFCSKGGTVLVLIVPPVRRVADDAGRELGRALYLADEIVIHGPVGQAFRREVADGALAARHEAWDELARRGRDEWLRTHGYVGK